MKRKSVFLVPALVLLPAFAQAQGSSAEALYKEAVDLFKGGNTQAACAKLDESLKLDPTTQTLFSLAKCREREGKLATAWTHFSELVARAQREKQKEKEEQMQAKVNELGARLPRASLKLDSHPEVTSVTLDGKPVPKATWSIALPLDPGEHVFVFSGTNKLDAEKKITVKEKESVTIDLEPLKDPSAPPPTTPPPDTSPDMPISNPDEGHKTLGYILGGVGIASIAAGSIFGVVAIGQKSDADDKFAARDPGFKDADNSASTSALVSTILFGVGIVGLGAGAYFVLTAPSKRTASAILNRVERGALLW